MGFPCNHVIVIGGQSVPTPALSHKTEITQGFLAFNVRVGASIQVLNKIVDNFSFTGRPVAVAE